MCQLSRGMSVVVLVAMMGCVPSSSTKESQDENVQIQENTQSTVPKNCVSEVYPTADVLPENLLRFYIYFSRPMKQENALSSIKLVDDEGETISGAFLENKFDLWSPNGKRLTLLFDPGRVKTGLVAHNRLGRALQANRSYELVIETTLLSIDDIPLAATYRKAFRVTEADFDAPNIEQWRLNIPKSESKDALRVTLNGPQDHVSLAYRIRVKDEVGKTVPGQIDLAEHESIWVFNPEHSWKSSGYTVKVDPLLEDIAGNRMTGLFEKPFVEDKSALKKPKTISFHPIDSNNNNVQTPNER